MKLEIITPGEKLYQGEVKLVKVPGTQGSFAILRNHAPLISTLEKGKIRIITDDDETKHIDIQGGIIEVERNNIIVLADV